MGVSSYEHSHGRTSRVSRVVSKDLASILQSSLMSHSTDHAATDGRDHAITEPIKIPEILISSHRGAHHPSKSHRPKMLEVENAEVGFRLRPDGHCVVCKSLYIEDPWMMMLFDPNCDMYHHHHTIKSDHNVRGRRRRKRFDSNHHRSEPRVHFQESRPRGEVFWYGRSHRCHQPTFHEGMPKTSIARGIVLRTSWGIPKYADVPHKSEVSSDCSKLRKTKVQSWIASHNRSCRETTAVASTKQGNNEGHSLSVQTSGDCLLKHEIVDIIPKVPLSERVSTKSRATPLTDPPSHRGKKPTVKNYQACFCGNQKIPCICSHRWLPDSHYQTRRDILRSREPFFHLFQHSFVSLAPATGSSDTALFGHRHCHAVLKEDLSHLRPPHKVPERLCEHLPPKTNSRSVRFI